MQKSVSTPKIGLAFSGASSRSIFYIGFLEVLKERGFDFDYIAAMSGASIVAASYACNTSHELKRLAFSLDKEVLYNFIERSEGKRGIYHMNKIEEMLRTYTRNMTFEETRPALGFVATDLDSGAEVVLQVGDIAKAICASCTLPGIFEPVIWGNKHLVDGGLVNIVPGNVAREAGCDIVIGIDMRATRHVFSSWQIWLKKFANVIKRILWPRRVDAMWQRVSDLLENTFFMDAYPHVTPVTDQSRFPNMFSVLGRTLDIAIEAQKKQKDHSFGCDLLIVPETPTPPNWKKYLFLHFTDFSNNEELYQSGREAAEKYLPKMKQLLSEWQSN